MANEDLIDASHICDFVALALASPEVPESDTLKSRA
jgi:hypothetical protein